MQPVQPDLYYGTSGPPDSPIAIVGEAWGLDELAAEKPFVGSSGKELDRILAEAGINRADCFCTNVVADRPSGNEMWRFFHPENDHDDSGNLVVRGLRPSSRVVGELDRLRRQLAAHPRSLVIGCGNYALWALTPHAGVNPAKAETGGRKTPNGIMNWRGSMTYTDAGQKFLPIIHPAAILRQWENRAVTVHDLKARVPLARSGDWRPKIPPVVWAPPTFDQARGRINAWLADASAGRIIELATDIETAKGLITCIGFADTPNFAMTVPFVRLTPERTFDSYWTLREEVTLVRLLHRLLTHPNIRIIGQNFIYDTQYIQHWLGTTPRLWFDTMLGHHLCFPGTPKGLDYLSSLYVKYHWYWKDDSKEWDLKGDLAQLLQYNALDNLRTIECAVSIREVITKMGMDALWEERLYVNNFCLRMMNRGVAVDRERRSRLNAELIAKQKEISAWLEKIFPQHYLDFCLGPQKTPWYRSPSQQQVVFGELLGMPLPKSRKTGNTTMAKEAIEALPKRHPAFRRVFEALGVLRSIGVFQSTFTSAGLDPDMRMRSSYNPAGTETFRLSSSKNAFGRGANLQNIPTGDEE